MTKHIPLRTCVGCSKQFQKNDLVRIVRTKSRELFVDNAKKKSEGRGVYICPKLECLQKAIKTKAFERSLKTSIGQEEIQKLQNQFIHFLADTYLDEAYS